MRVLILLKKKQDSQEGYGMGHGEGVMPRLEMAHSLDRGSGWRQRRVQRKSPTLPWPEKKEEGCFYQEGKRAAVLQPEDQLTMETVESASKLACSPPCTIETSLPLSKTRSSAQSSPPAHQSREKAFRVNNLRDYKGNLCRLCMLSSKRFTNKRKSTGSTFEENWWERERQTLRKCKQQNLEE